MSATVSSALTSLCTVPPPLPPSRASARVPLAHFPILDVPMPPPPSPLSPLPPFRRSRRFGRCQR
eukprot:4232723-Pleurochrysis_carterae.AAC.1